MKTRGSSTRRNVPTGVDGWDDCDCELPEKSEQNDDHGDGWSLDESLGSSLTLDGSQSDGLLVPVVTGCSSTHNKDDQTRANGPPGDDSHSRTDREEWDRLDDENSAQQRSHPTAREWEQGENWIPDWMPEWMKGLSTAGGNGAVLGSGGSRGGGLVSSNLTQRARKWPKPSEHECGDSAAHRSDLKPGRPRGGAPVPAVSCTGAFMDELKRTLASRRQAITKGCRGSGSSSEENIPPRAAAVGFGGSVMDRVSNMIPYSPVTSNASPAKPVQKKEEEWED
ncbi:hypothetical protein BV898_09485 [Hypsibius exemplaris]|uniref:Uncharacterized protein n=1 Tax=Hypsibius exemplaris TaxID=2072580 RepID=A0A1W0WMA0_HYPEX|nr:hypothetical protein BV898_09485 [Hypsibius exemplaris]